MEKIQSARTPQIKGKNNFKYASEQISLENTPRINPQKRILKSSRFHREEGTYTISEATKSKYIKRLRDDLEVIKPERKSKMRGALGLRNKSHKKIRLITINKPEEESRPESVINIQTKENMSNNLLQPMFEENKAETQGFTQYLNKMEADDTHTLSESKPNGLSPLSSKGRIKIISKRGKGRSTSQIFVRNHKKLKGNYSKKDFHVPGKKRLETKQVFRTSDRISYDFNKYQPFSLGQQKSISEAISDAQNQQRENKFIKANNYYLNNFAMNGESKNSFLSFKLNEILKEKKDLKMRLRSKLQSQPNMQKFKKVATFTGSKRHSSNPIQMLHKMESKKKINFEKKESLGDISDFSSDDFKSEIKEQEIEKSPKVQKEEAFENLIMKYSLKPSQSSPMIFESSLAHIKSMNSKMRFAHRIAKLVSPTNLP